MDMLAGGALRTPGWRGQASESRLVTGPGLAGGPADERLPLAEVIRAGGEAFASLFGAEPESVPGVEKVDDGWRLILEVTELERVPWTTSLMATYEVHLNEHCDLDGYRRTRGYYRNQAWGDEETVPQEPSVGPAGDQEDGAS